jgi:hypothetical protein
MNLLRYAFLLIVFIVTSTTCFPQSVEKHIHEREQLWLGYFNQTRLTNKFGIWFDIHYRQTDNFVDRPFQFLVRPAFMYFLRDNLRLQAGYAFVDHFPAKGKDTTRPEHRAWQQIWWNQKYSGLTTLQWFRLEERFNRKIENDVLLDDYNFNYRLRYNMSFFIPLKGKEITPRSPFVAVMNEVFINFGGKIVYNTFDQNRFFAGVGYQFTSHLNGQLGYMNVYQQEASGNNYLSTHAIRLFIFHSLDLRPKDKG